MAKPPRPPSPDAIAWIPDVEGETLPVVPAAILPAAPGEGAAVDSAQPRHVVRGEASRLLTMLASSGLVSICALIFNIVLTRTLSVADFGHLGTIRTVLDLLAVPAAFGMNASISRFAADARATPEQRSRMLVTALIITLVTSLATLGLGSLVLAWPAVLPDAVARGALRWMVVVLPFIALFGTAVGYLQGVGRVHGLAIAQGGRALMRLGLGSLLVLIWGFTGWMVSYVLIELLAFGATLPALLRDLRGRWTRDYLRPFAAFSGYATVTLALTTLLTGVDVLCLVHFHADPELIAHYKIATYIFTTALLLPNAFIQARWSRMIARAWDPDHTWSTLGRNTLYLMALVLPAAVLGYFLAPVLPLIFGPGYGPSVQIFQWLIPAFVIHSAGKLSSNLVVGAGLMRAQLVTSVATVLLNIALNFALIPSMGVAGAVIATTASLALKTALSPWILSRYRSAA